MESADRVQIISFLILLKFDVQDFSFNLNLVEYSINFVFFLTHPPHTQTPGIVVEL